eukprot:gene9811-11624_t
MPLRILVVHGIAITPSCELHTVRTSAKLVSLEIVLDMENYLMSRTRLHQLPQAAALKVTDSIKSSTASAKKPAEDVGYVAIGFELPQDDSEEEEEEKEKGQDSFWSFGENSTLQRVEAFCSWCLRKGVHTLVDKGYLSRSQFKCGLCSMPTVMCKLAAKSFKVYPCGFARSHTDGAEDACLVCARVLTEWRPELLISLDKVAFCSGCKRNSRHSFVKNAPKQQRNQFRCQGCSRRTFPCSSCETGMTLKGLPGFDLMNTRCLRCNDEETAEKNGGKTQKRLSIPSLPSMAGTNPFADPGLVVDKEGAKEVVTGKLPESVQGWCSWCDHFEYHHLAKPQDTSTSGSGLLHFMPKPKHPPAKPKYLCGGCMSPSLPCVTCKSGETRLTRYAAGGEDPALEDRLLEPQSSDIQETLEFLEQEASVLRDRRSFKSISNPFRMEVGIELDDSE